MTLETIVIDDGLEFEYIDSSKLPWYWQMKIEGGHWHVNLRNPICPYCGKRLFKLNEPVEHKHCFKCGRNYI